jgi:hypothetical protein
MNIITPFVSGAIVGSAITFALLVIWAWRAMSPFES